MQPLGKWGVGPAGLLLSAFLLAAAYLAGRGVAAVVALPSLVPGTLLPRIILFVAIVLALFLVLWSVRSLPLDRRGKGLCTTGAYHYVRHPVYAAFISIGAPGLALYLNSPIYLVWLVAIHPLWHRLVQIEERAMVEAFGEGYERYMERTGRFVPRFLPGLVARGAS